LAHLYTDDWTPNGPERQTHTIDLKPITLVCSAPEVGRISYAPQWFTLSFAETTYHAERVQVLHPLFPQFWTVLWEAAKLPVPDPIPDRLRQQGTGILHLMGLLDLSLKLFDQGVPLVWKHPESALHPRLQCALSDLLIALNQHYQFDRST